MMNWYRFAGPQAFYPLAGKMAPIFWALAFFLTLAGLAIGFLYAPADAQQGEGFRIIFLHVPTAWMSMFIYVVMAFWSILALSFNFRLSFMMAEALAPTGALFTFLSLWTGAFWGKPMWGSWWEWDARMTSQLILLFLYIGLMALQSSIEDPYRKDKASALLILVGLVNIPIIYFSVKWWNTLHQGYSVAPKGSALVSPEVRWGLILSSLGAWMYCIAASLTRVRRIILQRERHTLWVRKALLKEED